MTVSVFQQQTIAAAPGDWSATVPFNQFDPSGGLLVDAVFTTAGTIDASASIENLAPVAATVNLDVAAEVVASSTALQTSASVTPVAVASVDLPAYQGTIDGTLSFAALDFGGPSGTILPDLSASATQVAVVNVGTSGGSPLVGTGTIDVAVNSYATSTVEGNGNLAVLLHGSVGATLSLQYDAVTPSPGSSDDAGDSMSETSIYFAPSIGTLVVDNYATTTPQVVTLPTETSGWTSTASFARFNPALGTLDEVLLNVGNTIVSTFSAENLEPVPAFVSMNDTASMTVATPGEASGVSATASGWDPVTLGAYDGTMDFAGTSGQSIGAGEVSWSPNNATLTDVTDLAAFTGSGTIALPVSSAGSSVLTGPSNLLAEITGQTGGTVSVSYVYTPFSITGQTTDTTGPLAHAGVSAQTAAAAGRWSVNAPEMTFLGGFQGPTSVGANPNETFLIGVGADAVINGFSIGAGDKLNLTSLLAGAALAPDLSNLGNFLSVTGQTPGWINGWNTTLAVNGPEGAASLVLSGPSAVAVLDLLNAKALILPSH